MYVDEIKMKGFAALIALTVSSLSITLVSGAVLDCREGKASGFVGTTGQKFTLDGSDFIVAGTNAYWLAQVSDEDIHTAFSDIAAAGLTTVRTM